MKAKQSPKKKKSAAKSVDIVKKKLSTAKSRSRQSKPIEPTKRKSAIPKPATKSRTTKTQPIGGKLTKKASGKANTKDIIEVNRQSRAQRISSSQLAASLDDLEIASEHSTFSKKLVVVGIGASAGGLEALQVLIPTLPNTKQITYVLAQHLDPKHPSMLVSLLSRLTDMTVKELKDQTIPKPGHVYITPPNRNVVFQEGQLHLLQPAEGSLGPKPSIDIFFFSLGEQLSEGAVGIILSGTGSDGAHGVKAIKANGGLTIVQDPASAKYDGMPRTAIDTGCVDLILPAPEIGRELPGILVYPTSVPHLTQEEGALKALQSLYARLYQSTGCDFSEYKQNTIHRRIRRRMVVHKLSNLSDYLELVESSRAELDALYKDIIISVTSFFRDAEAFVVLNNVISQIIDTKHEGDSLRIWVPGCASGEEAYSIAMLVTAALVEKKKTVKTSIFATDIDTDALARARKGLYPEAALLEVDKAIVKKYFSRSENYYRVIKSIREMVVFSRQDLVNDPPFSRLDLVSCRNVLIYFSPHLQQRMLPMFHYILNPNGCLFLGKSESTGQFIDLFSPVEKKAKIFRRRGGGRTRRAQPGTRTHYYYKPLTPMRPQPHHKDIPLSDIVNRLVAEAYSPPGVVVDDHLDVIHVRGNVNQYLTLAQGEAGLNVMAMIRPELRAELRCCLMKCQREQAMVVSKSLAINTNDLEHMIKLHLRPIKEFTRASGVTLISFEPVVKAPPAKRTAGSIKSFTNDRIKELESELTATQEHLQTTVEELETANEELQSLNEELQSANEELQSSNEELETSNEELQSTNEELTTLNEEIQERSAVLNVINSDLENIQRAIGLSLLVVDKACRLTRFTPEADKIFEVSEQYLGQSLMTVPCHVDIPSLRSDLQSVITQERTMTREIQHGRTIWLMQVFPYHDGLNHQTAGAVLLFTDKTADREAEQALRESEARFRQITECIHDVFWVSDPSGQSIKYVSPAYEKVWGHTCQKLYDQDLSWPAAVHPDDQTAVRETFLNKAAEGAFNQDYRIVRSDGTQRWIWDQAFPVRDAEGNLVKLVGIAQDITIRKHIEARLHEKEQRFRAIFDSAFQFLALLSTDGTVREMNHTMLQFCGVSENDMIGKFLWDGPLKAINDSRGRQIQHAISSVVQGGEFARYTGDFLGGQGKSVSLDLSFRGIKGQQTPLSAVLLEGRILREEKRNENP